MKTQDRIRLYAQSVAWGDPERHDVRRWIFQHPNSAISAADRDISIRPKSRDFGKVSKIVTFGSESRG